MARRSSQIRTHDSESQSGTPYWLEGKAPRTSVRNGETVASAPGAARSLTARQVRLKARRSSRIRTHDSESRPGAPYWPEGEAPRTSVRKPKPECQDGVPGWLAAEASFAVRQNGETLVLDLENRHLDFTAGGTDGGYFVIFLVTE